jgi:hypothetical protein
MPTANEFRQHAQACLTLASTAIDFYAQNALLELASDFEKMAESLEQRTINPELHSRR